LPCEAEWVIGQGYADLVAFGRPFVANPELPLRLEQGLPLAALDHATLFGGTAKGYSDYPSLTIGEAACAL
jgi:N-ethylmaleimide reductase